MNSTRTKLKVATTATIGDCKVTLSKSQPRGAKNGPKRKEDAYLRQITAVDEARESAAMIITRPTRARVTTKKWGLKRSMHCFGSSREGLGRASMLA